MTGDGQPSPETRLAIITEAAIVVGLGLAAAWIIPGQTTQGPVLGLPPVFLPTACAGAIVFLGALGLALRLWKPELLRPERLAPWWPAASMLAVLVAGVLALQFAGPFASGLIIVALGLAVLGERRVPVLIGTIAASTIILGLVFRIWR